MPPITNLDDIAIHGQIKIFERSYQPNPFNVLILGDGFTESENDKRMFENLRKSLSDFLLKVPPFTYCKPYINIMYSYLVSQNTGINSLSDWLNSTEYSTGDEVVHNNKYYRSLTNNNISNSPTDPIHWTEVPFRTVFNLYKTTSGHIEPRDIMRPVEVVKRLSLPNNLDLPQYLSDPESIWFNYPVSKSYGAVCILSNTKEGGGKNFSGTDLRTGNMSPWRYFIISLEGINDSNPTGKHLHTFVHELAHSIRLGDEYEGMEDKNALSISQGKNINKQVENIFHSFLGQGAGIREFIAAAPWKKLMTDKERQEIENKNFIFFKDEMETAGIISDAAIPDKEIYPTVPGTNLPVHWDQIYIIEGGGHRRRFFYRSNFECRMRHDSFDERYTSNPEEYSYVTKINDKEIELYGAPEFCRVCNHQIRQHITGWEEYGLNAMGRAITRLELMSIFYHEIMPRLKKSFDIENRINKRGPGDIGHRATNKFYCEIASARAYIMFRNYHKTRDLDIRFVINGLHVCLYYNGVYLDPTFYDFYRVGNEPTLPLRYAKIEDDGTISLHEFEMDTTLGLIGDFYELESFFIYYLPREYSYSNVSPSRPEEIHIITCRIFNLSAPWTGWPGPDRAGRDHESVVGRGQKVEQYVDIIFKQWSNWNDYLSDGRYPYLKPLYMKLPLKKVQELE